MSSVRTTTIDKVSTFLPPNADNPFVIDHSSTARVADAQPDGATVESETRMSIDYSSGIRITVDTHALVTQTGMTLNAVATENGHECWRKRWTR